jgi:hypothetical protein
MGGGGAAEGGLGAEYSAEADLVRRQTAALLALLAQPPSSRDALGRGFRVPSPALPQPQPPPAAPAAPQRAAPAAPAPAPASAPSPSKSSAKGTFSATALAAGVLLSGGSASSGRSLGSGNSLTSAATVLSSKQSAATATVAAAAPAPAATAAAARAAERDKEKERQAAATVGASAWTSKQQQQQLGPSKPLSKQQTGAMAGPPTAMATAAAPQQGLQGPMNPEDLEAARDLLSIQTGGNGWFLITRLKEEVAAGMAAASAPAAGPDGDSTASGPAGAAAAAGGGGWWGRRVSEGAFEVLGEMVVALFSAAAAQEDWRVVLAVLQVSCCVSCTTGKGICAGERGRDNVFVCVCLCANTCVCAFVCAPARMGSRVSR